MITTVLTTIQIKLMTALPTVVQPDPTPGLGSKLIRLLSGDFMYLALALCVLAVIAGGVAMAIGRGSGNGAAQKWGLGFIIGGVIGGAVIGSAAALVNTGFNTGI